MSGSAIQELSGWLSVANPVITIVLLAAGFYLRNTFVPRVEFKVWADDAGERLTAHSQRFNIIEFKQQSGPTPADIAALKDVISDLRTSVAVLTERLDARESLEPLVQAIKDLAERGR